MGVFEATGGDTHGDGLFGPKPASRSKAVIAGSSTVPGPNLGGTRFLPYDATEAVITDDCHGNGAVR